MKKKPFLPPLVLEKADSNTFPLGYLTTLNTGITRLIMFTSFYDKYTYTVTANKLKNVKYLGFLRTYK